MKLRSFATVSLSAAIAAAFLTVPAANAAPIRATVPAAATPPGHSVSKDAYPYDFLATMNKFVRSGNGKAIKFAYTGKFTWDYFSEVPAPDGTGPGNATIIMNPDGSYTDVENYAGLTRTLKCAPVKNDKQTCYIKDPGSSTWEKVTDPFKILNYPQLDFIMDDFAPRQQMPIVAPGSIIKAYETSDKKLPMTYTLLSNNNLFPDMVSTHVSVFTKNKYTSKGTYMNAPGRDYAISVTFVPKKKVTYPTADQLGPKAPIPQPPPDPEPTPEPEQTE